MARFELKEQLPKATRDRLELLMAKQAAGEYLFPNEQAFLDALLPYQKNKVIIYDTTHIATPQEPNSKTKSTDNIIQAEGNSLPTGYEGFSIGAFYMHIDGDGRKNFVNDGTTTSAVWHKIGNVAISSASSSISASPSPSPSASKSLSPSASLSRSPSVSVSASPSITPSSSVSLSPSVSDSASKSLSPSASASITPSASVSASISSSVSRSPSQTPSSSVSLSPSITPSASISSSISASPSFPDA